MRPASVFMASSLCHSLVPQSNVDLLAAYQSPCKKINSLQLKYADILHNPYILQPALLHIMKAAGISDIKNELGNLAPERLAALCLQLAKYKKDNKELLSYLLFEEHDMAAYIESVKKEIDIQFTEINASHLYFAKKTLRKILRITGKHIRYTGSRQAEAELLIYFCQKLKNSGIHFENSIVLVNLYNGQLKKINAAIAGFHEDLQYDYLKEIKKLV